MGKQLPGYRITRQIGTGAGSKIYLATDLNSGETVAVKHVVRESADSLRFFKQAETEYEVSSKLDDPYLRRSYEASLRRTTTNMEKRQARQEVALFA